MKLQEIADRINKHLKRFEADPKINVPIAHGTMKLHPYYNAAAYSAGSKIGVRYVSYQYTAHLTKADALAYLEWLDAGGIGTHYEMKRSTPAVVRE